MGWTNCGAIFRNIYRDFLQESFKLLHIDPIEKSYNKFVEIANLWTTVAELFNKIGDTKDVEYVNIVSELLVEISEKERNAMELLSRL